MKTWKDKRYFAKCSIYALCLVLFVSLFVGCKITVKLGQDSTAPDFSTESPAPDTTEVSSVTTTTDPVTEPLVTSAVPVTTETVTQTTAPIDPPEDDTYHFDLNSDGISDTLKVVRGDKTHTILINDSSEAEKEYTIHSELNVPEDVVKFEKNKYGWKASVDGEISYIRAHDLIIDEPFFDQPKVVFSKIVSREYWDIQTFACVYNIYVSETTIVGAIYEHYSYIDGEYRVTSLTLGKSLDIRWWTEYPKHSNAYEDTFLPDGATSVIAHGTIIGSEPQVYSYATEDNVPCVYYTYDLGTVFLPLAVEIPETCVYESARVVEILGGNSAELHLIVELQNDGKKEYGYVPLSFENFGRDGRFENHGFSNRDFHNGEPRYYCDFTGDGYLDVLETVGGASNTAESVTVWDEKKHRLLPITHDFATVHKKFLCEAVEDGWKIMVDGKSSYVMAGAFAKNEKLYDSPRLSTSPYYVTEYSDDVQSSFCTGDYSLKRCYDIYLGENTICGAVCESMTLQNGRFVPSKWEFVCSPNSTYVAIQDWSKKYSESFMPEEAASLLCQGGDQGREVLLFSYRRKDSIYADSIVFISYDKGASYIEFEIPVPENFAYTRVVDILPAASTELRVIFKNNSQYTELLYQLGGYLWQCPPYYTGASFKTVPHAGKYDFWEKETIPERAPKRVWHDFTADGCDEVVTFLPSPNESGEIGYVYDPIRKEQQIIKNRIGEDIIQYERTEWGWKAKINNEIVYIRTDDLKTEEPLLDQPKAVLVNAYAFEPDVTSDKVALQCIYNLYATESTLVGAIYETYAYQDDKLSPIIWEYGESPSISGPQYQKHAEEYIYSFLPEGAVAPITSGAPVGNVPTVISYDSDNGEPLLYYTYDNGMTFLPLTLEMPDGVSYDSARVVYIGAGNSRELYLEVEFVRDGHKEYYRILYDYYNEYADGRFRPYGEWEEVKEKVYYDFTGDGTPDALE